MTKKKRKRADRVDRRGRPTTASREDAIRASKPYTPPTRSARLPTGEPVLVDGGIVARKASQEDLQEVCGRSRGKYGALFDAVLQLKRGQVLDVETDVDAARVQSSLWTRLSRAGIGRFRIHLVNDRRLMIACGGS